MYFTIYYYNTTNLHRKDITYTLHFHTNRESSTVHINKYLLQEIYYALHVNVCHAV